MCKPLHEVDPEEINEGTYQDCQILARNVVERVNGQIKKEFAILEYGEKNTLLYSCFC